jgi:hypothetical protein
MATYHEHRSKGRKFRIQVSGLTGGSATGGFQAQPFEILKDGEVEFGPPVAYSTEEGALERARQAIDRTVSRTPTLRPSRLC